MSTNLECGFAYRPIENLMIFIGLTMKKILSKRTANQMSMMSSETTFRTRRKLMITYPIPISKSSKKRSGSVAGFVASQPNLRLKCESRVVDIIMVQKMATINATPTSIMPSISRKNQEDAINREQMTRTSPGA